MKKHLLIIGITLLLLVVGLSGCNDDDQTNNPLEQEKYRFVGTWSTDITDSKVWDFQDTLHVSMETSDGTMHDSYWRLEDALVYIFSPEVGYFYEFSANDMVLTFSVDGDSNGHPTYIVLIRANVSQATTSFTILSNETTDNFASASGENFTGIVWVNMTVKNNGPAGLGSVVVIVYQGTEEYTDCGAYYYVTKRQSAYLPRDGTTTLHFVFTGLEAHNNTGCYGMRIT